MPAIAFLGIAVAVVTVGTIAMWVANRPREGRFGSINEFSDRMDSLRDAHEQGHEQGHDPAPPRQRRRPGRPVARRR